MQECHMFVIPIKHTLLIIIFTLHLLYMLILPLLCIGMLPLLCTGMLPLLCIGMLPLLCIGMLPLLCIHLLPLISTCYLLVHICYVIRCVILLKSSASAETYILTLKSLVYTIKMLINEILSSKLLP